MRIVVAALAVITAVWGVGISTAEAGGKAAPHGNAVRTAGHNPGNPHGGQFAANHPRRNEVNNRVAEQRHRIEQGVASGKLTPTQAKQLLANDRAIKKQEHAEVKANGGYLTKAQQQQLNQEENANSKLIYNDKHPQ